MQFDIGQCSQLIWSNLFIYIALTKIFKIKKSFQILHPSWENFEATPDTDEIHIIKFSHSESHHSRQDTNNTYFYPSEIWCVENMPWIFSSLEVDDYI